MQFYILMIDYGTDVRKVHGLEAVIHPEDTRRQIVAQVRDVLASDDRSIVHIKFVDTDRPTEADYIEDVTEEIVAEAAANSGLTFDRPNPADRQAAAWDRARDLRKHGEVV